MICVYTLPGYNRSRDESLPRGFKKEGSELSLETMMRNIPLNLILFLYLKVDRSLFFFFLRLEDLGCVCFIPAVNLSLCNNDLWESISRNTVKSASTHLRMAR